MKNLLLTLFFLFFTWFSAFGQSTNIPLNQFSYHLIDRYEIKSGAATPKFHSTFKPLQRATIAHMVDSLWTVIPGLNQRDQFNLQYLSNDSWEWSEKAQNESKRPILKHLYKKKSDLYYVDTKDFDLHINPVLYLGIGHDSQSGDRTYVNTRGVEVRGMINRKLGFYSFLGENQIFVPGYVKDYIRKRRVVPGEGFWKGFKEGGYDFFTASGYISFNAAEVINLQFGQGKHFIGNGYRSMILSDFSNNYLFLKASTKVWRINYTNLFAELRADAFGSLGGSAGNDPFPKKYMALHHLSINISKHLNIGLFETIIFGGQDENGQSQFELSYLNPIIFYRAIEQQGGSPDNATLGADFKWNFAKRFSLYGQLIVDEFILDEFLAGKGSWVNKFGFQGGIKYIDALGIDNLDLQLETNWARPYLYAHNKVSTNYSHYGQPLAHPLGANFKEFIGIARFQPMKRLRLTGKLMYAEYGEDTDGSNWGGDIFLPYGSRERQDQNNEGHFIGQGVGTQLVFADFTASYQLKHNLFIDLKQTFRQLDSDLDQRDSNTSYTAIAVRLNIPERLHEF